MPHDGTNHQIFGPWLMVYYSFCSKVNVIACMRFNLKIQDGRHLGNPAISTFDRVHSPGVWNVPIKFEIDRVWRF